MKILIIILTLCSILLPFSNTAKAQAQTTTAAAPAASGNPAPKRPPITPVNKKAAKAPINKAAKPAQANAAAGGKNAAKPNDPNAAPDAPTFPPLKEGEIDPKVVDQSLMKANLLEGLLHEKISKIVETHVPQNSMFRVSVSTAVRRIELKPKEIAPEKKQEYRPEAPVAEGSIFDLQRLVDHYEDEMEAVKHVSRPINVNIQSDKTSTDANAVYEVEKLNVILSFDESTPDDKIEEVAADVKKFLEPVFTERLELQTATSKMAPSTADKVFERIHKIQYLITALALGFILLVALMLNKTVPSWQSKFAVLSENKNESREEVESKNKPNEEGEEESEEEDTQMPMADGPAPTSTKEALISLKELEELEKQVALFSKSNPKIVHALLQEWSGNEDKLESLALALETLARHAVSIPRVEVRGSVLKRIKEAKANAGEMTLETKFKSLNEIYWNLISMSFVGEELAVSPFLFLESVPDQAVSEMILEESVESKASILMGINERRAAKILGLLPSLEREQIFSQICSGTQPLDAEQMGELLERLKGKVDEHLRTHDRRLESAGKGVEALAPILQTMDFNAQFTTAKSLMNLDISMRRTLEKLYFNVAFLPDAKQEFLSTLFVDKPTEWIRNICSQFTEEFKQRVISVLPPMQQQMITEDNAPINPIAALTSLKELDDQIWDRILKKEVQLAEIFPTDEEINAMAAGGQNAAA